MNTLTEIPTEGLCDLWQQHKNAEAKERNSRVEIEQELEERLKSDLPELEGSRTIDCDGFKIKATKKLTKKIDETKWNNIKQYISEELHPVKYKPQLENKGLKYLAENRPEVYELVSKAIEVKPAKTAFTIENSD